MTLGAAPVAMDGHGRASGAAIGERELYSSARIERVAYALVLIGAAAVTFGLLRQPERTWSNLLLDNFYLLSVGLGGALFISIQHLCGAGWCAGLRRVPEALMGALVPAALLVLTLFFGRQALYHWSVAGGLGAGILPDKAAYLSTPFVFLRMLIVLGLWVFLAARLRRLSLQQDREAGLEPHHRLVRVSAIFTVVFALTFSLASFDWLMSLDAHWFSTIFAVYVFAGLFVLTLAVMTLTTILLAERGDLAGVVNANHFHDLGKLLFAFSTFWAYIWLSQYLLIWYGNLPEEISHYLSRTNADWLGLFLLNLVVNWLVPFVVLMSRPAKRNPTVLKGVCVLLLGGRWLDLYLIIVPELAGRPSIGWLEVLIFAGYAGLLVAIVVRSLAHAPLVARNDPYFEESLGHRQ